MTPGARFEYRHERKKERYSTSKENFFDNTRKFFFFFLLFFPAKVGNFPSYTTNSIISKKDGYEKMITDRNGSRNDDCENITSENGNKMERRFLFCLFFHPFFLSNKRKFVIKIFDFTKMGEKTWIEKIDGRGIFRWKIKFFVVPRTLFFVQQNTQKGDNFGGKIGYVGNEEKNCMGCWPTVKSLWQSGCTVERK